MESYICERPLAPLAGLAPMSAVQVMMAAEPAVRMMPTVDVPWRPQAHQAQVQSELVQALVSFDAYGINGTNGSTGKDIPASVKRTDVRGVPPRGKPV